MAILYFGLTVGRWPPARTPCEMVKHILDTPAMPPLSPAALEVLPSLPTTSLCLRSFIEQVRGWIPLVHRSQAAG